MTGSVAIPDPQALLEQEAFVRNLARSLLHDDHAVDDVVQEAWLQAMQRPPQQPGALRAWLATVVRNLSRNRLKADRARQRREAAAARDELVPSAATIREREALRSEVVEAVLALPEPYRATLVLRYFEDLTPKEIGQRLALPASTVRTHVSRGLALVRERLDASHGDRRSWCLALVPLARPRWVGAAATGGTVLIGGLAVKKSYLTLAALLLLTTAAVVVANPFSTVPTDAGTTPMASGGSVAAKVEETETRTPVVARLPKSAPAAGVSAGLRGRLLTADGQPLPNVEYWVQTGVETVAVPRDLEPPSTQRTDARGGYHVTPAEGPAEGFLWFRIDSGLALSFRVDRLRRENKRDLRVPPRAPLRIDCDNRQPGSTWRVLIYPVVRGGGLAEHRLEKGEHGEADYVVSGLVEGGTDQSSIEFSLLAGKPYRVFVEGRSFKIAGGDDENVVRPPARVGLQAGDARPTIPVRVVDRFEQVVAVAGKVVIGPLGGNWRNTQQLVDGRVTMGYLNLEDGAKYGLWVLLDDGEVFHRVVTIAGQGAQPEQRFAKGQGAAPRQLVLTGLGDAGNAMPDIAMMALECGDGRLGYGAADLSFFGDDSELFGYSRETARRFRLVGLPAGWKRLFVLCVDGTLAIAEHTTSKRITIRLQRGAALPALDVRKEYERLAFDKRARVRFEVQLDTSPRQWVVLESAPLARDGATWPTWRKFAPLHLPYRVLLTQSGREEDVTPRR